MRSTNKSIGNRNSKVLSPAWLLCGLAIIFATLLLSIDVHAKVANADSSDVKYVRIGVSASFSGSRRSPSLNGLYGMLAMVDWINNDDNPGFKIGKKRLKFNLEIHDDSSSNDNVEQIYSSLAKGSNNVDFLIGPYSSTATRVAAEISEERKILLVAPFGASDSLYENPSEWRVQVGPPASRYYKELVAMLSEKASTLGITLNTALAFETDTFSTSVYDATKELVYADTNFNIFFDPSYPSEGGDLLTVGGDMDAFVNELLDSIDSDSIVIIGGGHDTDGIAFAQLLDSKEYTPAALALLIAPAIPTFFCDVAQADAGCTESYAEGVTSVISWLPTLETFKENITNVSDGLNWVGPSHDEALELIKSKNGDVEPSYQAGSGGQAILALASAMENAQSTKKKKVRDAIKKLRFQSCFGNYGVDKDTGIQELQDMFVVQWQVISDEPELHVVWPQSTATKDFVFPMP